MPLGQRFFKGFVFMDCFWNSSLLWTVRIVHTDALSENYNCKICTGCPGNVCRTDFPHWCWYNSLTSRKAFLFIKLLHTLKHKASADLLCRTVNLVMSQIVVLRIMFRNVYSWALVSCQWVSIDKMLESIWRRINAFEHIIKMFELQWWVATMTGVLVMQHRT